MSESKRLLQGTVVVAVGRVVGYGLSFLRNLIVARVLAKADYGLAAVFAMAMALLEIGGNMAFGAQVIQSRQGDTPAFQASAQALQFACGLCSAVLLVGMSVPMAHFFGVPHVWWAFALLGIVPLCQGLGHLDISRRQRNFDYLPLVLVDVVPQFVITMAAWPLAVWLGDYRVVVCLMITKAVLGNGMTFVLARRPYSWAWESAYIRGMLRFGWPMLLTSLIIFCAQQADQMLVGSVFSLDVLANYSLALSLVSIPWVIFSQVGGSLMLPMMSRVQDDLDRFRGYYRACAQTAAIAAGIAILPIIVVGEQLVTLLYGNKYEGSGLFVAVLGATSALRFIRFAPAIASSARADTMNHLYSNMWRGTSLPLALGVVATGGTPVQIAACALVGEMLAVIASMVRLARQNVPLRDSYSACVYLVALMSLGWSVAFLGGAAWSLGLAAGAAIGAFAIAVGAAWFMFPDVPRVLIESVRNRAGAGGRAPAPQ